MNGKNIELLVENDRSWKFEWIFKQAITCGNVMACLESAPSGARFVCVPWARSRR